MFFKTGTIGAAALTMCVAAGSAHADFTFGSPLVIAENNTVVTATFISERALWTGALYAVNPNAPASLGTFLFNNHAARAGDTKTVGTFNAGYQLWFNYKVAEGMPNVWRQQTPADALHFGLQQISSTRYTMNVEDMPLTIADRDYDDCVVLLTFSKAPLPPGGGGESPEVPTPGALGVFAAAGLMGARRRR